MYEIYIVSDYLFINLQKVLIKMSLVLEPSAQEIEGAFRLKLDDKFLKDIYFTYEELFFEAKRRKDRLETYKDDKIKLKHYLEQEEARIESLIDSGEKPEGIFIYGGSKEEREVLRTYLCERRAVFLKWVLEDSVMGERKKGTYYIDLEYLLTNRPPKKNPSMFL